jgi:2-polyprenyl-3-methyl-5-hydroxy-6-metoxy-1,4-benzoquinol methylase
MAVSEQPERSGASCRVCGSACRPGVVAHGVPYDRCASCGTLQKQLSPEEFEDIEFTYDPGSYLDEQDLQAIRDHLDVESKKALLRSFAPDKVDRGGTFLDIGCGMGGYLLAAQELGFEVMGFEPSANHSRVARGKLGLPVVENYFTASSVGGRKFDLVMLSHVIEHIYEPKSFLDDVLSVLAPGGKLLLLTPNANSFSARVMGGAWPMLDQVDHVTMLTPDAMRRLIGGGFDVTVATTEYPHEFVTTIIGGLRRKLARRDRGPAHAVPGERPALMQRNGATSRAAKAVLALASFPFYVAAKASDRASCIALVARRGEAES